MAVSVHERTRVQLCGQMSVEIEGVEVAQGLRGRQVRLLLAYLLLNRTRAMGREELIGALWPSQAPVSEDGALRTLLSRLRSALGSKALQRTRGALARPSRSPSGWTSKPLAPSWAARKPRSSTTTPAPPGE